MLFIEYGPNFCCVHNIWWIKSYLKIHLLSFFCVYLFDKMINRTSELSRVFFYRNGTQNQLLTSQWSPNQSKSNNGTQQSEHINNVCWTLDINLYRESVLACLVEWAGDCEIRDAVVRSRDGTLSEQPGTITLRCFLREPVARQIISRIESVRKRGCCFWSSLFLESIHSLGLLAVDFEH